MVPATGAKPLRRASRVCEVSHPRLRDPQVRDGGIERRLRAGAGLSQRLRTIIGLLRVRQRRLGLVEIGKLEIVVDGIEVIADLHFVALADIELRHPARFVRADIDHVGLDPALEAGIALLLATGKPGCEHGGQCKCKNYS